MFVTGDVDVIFPFIVVDAFQYQCVFEPPGSQLWDVPEDSYRVVGAALLGHSEDYLVCHGYILIAIHSILITITHSCNTDVRTQGVWRGDLLLGESQEMEVELEQGCDWTNKC